jgi:preprotein translocase subunit SecB
MSPNIDSILKLNDLRTLKTYFEVAADAGAFDTSKLGLAIDVAVLQSDESEDDMAVQLSVHLNRDEDQFSEAGFTGSVVVAGFFNTSVLKEEHPEDWEPALIYNGVTVLMGTVRTIYAELSASSPAGRIVLPTINVGQMLNHVTSEAENTSDE